MKKTQHDINYNQCRAGSLYTFHAEGTPSLPADHHDNSSKNTIHNQQQWECTTVNYDNTLEGTSLTLNISLQYNTSSTSVQPASTVYKAMGWITKELQFHSQQGQKKFFSTPKHQDQQCSPPRLYLMRAGGSYPEGNTVGLSS